MAEKQPLTPEERAAKRAKYLTGLMWHAGAFVIINAFFWLLDAWGEGGINWAYIITAAWGFALAFHALAYWVDGRQVEERKARQYLREEQKTG
jgi:hypothetical protein